MPLAGLALLLALDAGRRRSWALVAATATATGITWAANPWAMPPTVVACGLLVVCGDGRWDWPWSGGWANGGRRWLAVLSLPVGGWLITAPFHLRFSPPFQGLGLVHAWTGVRDVLLWGGVILLPVLVVVAAVVWRVLRGGDPLRGPAVLVAACAVVVVAAAAGRAVLVMIAGAAAVMIWQTVAPRSRCHRPAAALAALGLFLLAVPEVVHVVDAYGHQLHRMNTVFKAWIQAWPLLAVAIPSLMTTTVEVRWRRDLVALLVLLAALPHPAGIVWRGVTAARPGLDGLVWMADEDRALVGALRRQPAGASLVEAVGPAYSEYARLSSASGVPALLGWANHELVWRGAAIHAETERRRRIVDEIYRCGEPERIRELARTEGVDLIAVGSLERQDYGAAGLAAVRRAGPVVVEEGDAFLVAVAERSGEGS